MNIKINFDMHLPLRSTAGIVGFLVLIGATVAAGINRASASDIGGQGMFATDELDAAYEIKTPAVQTLAAGDGVTLAYYPFKAPAAIAKLVFYHGGGAHSLAGYQKLADTLSRKYRVSTYLVDIRGHGRSGGPRGDAPTPEQLWQDVATVVAAIRSEAPRVPLLLGAHSSGSGLLLNYLTWSDSAAVKGIVMIAPEFGYKADTKRANGSRFAEVSYLPVVVNVVSGGYFCGHCQAVHFNYAQETLAKTGLLRGYTINMSRAVTPGDPSQQLHRLKGRLGIWVGSEDELFDVDKLRNFVDSARSADLAADFTPVRHAKHLSILVHVDALVGDWIVKTLR